MKPTQIFLNYCKADVNSANLKRLQSSQACQAVVANVHLTLQPWRDKERVHDDHDYDQTSNGCDDAVINES